jgi:hypothetical protein
MGKRMGKGMGKGLVSRALVEGHGFSRVAMAAIEGFSPRRTRDLSHCELDQSNGVRLV